MTLNEVNTLKSDILFGSSHCSCGSCESILCFTKRNIKPNQCRCSVCNEPNSCTVLRRKDHFNNTYIDNGPYDKLNYSSPKKVKTKSTSFVDGAKTQVNNLDFNLLKKNVTEQITAQQIWETTIKYKNENKQSPHSNSRVIRHSPLGNIIKKMLTTYNETSVQDVVDKIKGIYNSCSLKVCECVVTSEKSICKCKPCECVDCKTYQMANYPLARPIYPLANKTKPYSEQTCQCKPCDCEKCKMYTFKINDNGETLFIKKTIFNEPSVYRNRTSKNNEMKQSQGCSCKPCQCSKCNSIFRVENNVVVGSVEQYLQQDDCLCLPCNCSNCRQLGAPITHNMMHEMSTDMVQDTNCLCDMCLNNSCRQTTEPCRCESRNSVINKPFVNDTQNIDIHRAFVMKKSNYDKSNQTCTISINILNGMKNKAEMQKTGDCTHDKSSTSVCACEVKNSSCNILTLCPKDSLLSRTKDEKNTTCQCHPCECKICDKYKTVEGGVLKSPKFRSKCNCDICHCLYCTALLQSEKIEIENKNTQMPADLNTPSYKLTLNINQSVLPPSIQGLRNAKNKVRKQSAKINKETCTNNKEEPSSMRTRGTRNISLQIHAAPSSGTIGYKINNYLMQLPSISFQSPPAKYENISIHSNVDNTLVKTFVNEIMHIDEFGRLNFISGSGSSENISVNDVIDKSLTSMWSFPEDMRTQIKGSSSNIVDKKLENCDLKKISIINNSKHSQKPRQNTFLNKRKDLNEPCIFCGMCTFYKKSIETKSDERVQSIRQCFAKTNIALINQNNESIQINHKSIEDNKCRQPNKSLEERTLAEKFEGDLKVADTEALVELNENITLKYCNDYFEQRNILFKAKLLTSELLKMLYKYQKANNEFKSVTKKITNVCDENFNNENKLLLPQESCRANLNFKYSWSRLACVSKNQKVDNFQSYSKDTGEITNEKIIDSVGTIIDMPENSQLFKQKEYFGTKLNNAIDDNLNVTNDYSKCKEDMSKIFKELSSKSTLRDKLSHGKINVIHSDKVRKDNNLINLNNVNYNINENRDKNYNEHKRYHHMIESFTQNQDQDEKAYEERKLFEKTDPFQLMNEVVVSSPSGEIRQVIKSIYDTCNVIEPRECLLNTQREQECLKCGVDCFKVHSLSLRKISDHTVFIKWKKPSDMSRVQGYELFVDDCLVKKIYNPALTMAVVTCLPRREKILFTIITLTEPPTGNHFKASMIYCQR